MRKIIISEVIRPTFHRIGTAIGAALVGYGISQGVADQIVLGFTATAGVLLDLVVRKVL